MRVLQLNIDQLVKSFNSHLEKHFNRTFNLFSISSNGLIFGAQNLSRRQSVFFLPGDPRNEDHQGPDYIDFSAPRLACYMHRAWKRHQDAVFWVDIDLGIREGLISLRQDRTQLFFKEHFQPIAL